MILSIQELSIFSRERTIVDQVSLAVREGEFMALVGQSGSGKSLLSQAIGQAAPPNLRASGRVLFEGAACSNGNRRRCEHCADAISRIFFRTIREHLHLFAALADTLTNIRRCMERSLPRSVKSVPQKRWSLLDFTPSFFAAIRFS